MTYFRPHTVFRDTAATAALGCAAVGIIMLAIFFWWPLLSYSAHYWFGGSP